MYYTAHELAETLSQEGGEVVTVRKIRYYAQLDMLSSPEIVNGKKKYTEKHLEELRAIRKLQKTGTKLEGIKAEIRDLDIENLSKVSENATYFSQKQVLDKNVVEINEQVALLLSHQVSEELRTELIKGIEQVIQKHKGEL